MESVIEEHLWNMIGLRYKSHPWHGVDIGEQAPELLTAFIEIIPTDTVKYEIDKVSGYLKIDRPQKFSNVIPALYGFIPRTFCKENIAAYCMSKTGRSGIRGDDDPLDICVLTSREISHGDILVRAVPIGGFRLIDNNEADDKIIAVLHQDDVFGDFKDVSDLPEAVVNRLMHYFLTYKQLPAEVHKCEITHTYGRSEALEVIQIGRKDYHLAYGHLEEMLSNVLKEVFDKKSR
jgi:inorganic pyrophosphatase